MKVMVRRTYTGLDSLRGLAALIVLVFHLSAMFKLRQLFPSGYLSVDLFFMMSGFVIAQAYGPRLKSRTNFFKFAEIRFVRLYPVYALGVLLGVITPTIVALTLQEVWPLRIFVHGLPFAVIVAPILTNPSIAWFSYNPPAWSLFFEWWSNLLYAALRKSLHSQIVIVVIVLPAPFLMYLLYMYGKIIATPSSSLEFTAETARAVFGLFFGVFLSKLSDDGYFQRLPSMFLVSITLLLAAMALPSTVFAPGLFPAFIVFVINPVIVVIAVSRTEPVATQKIEARIGAISYPLYGLHWNVIITTIGVSRIFGAGIETMATISFIAVLIISVLAERYFDRPVRKYLTGKIAARRSQIEAAPAF